MNIKGEIYKQRVNSFVGIALIGSFALCAGTIIWEAAHNENPIAKAFDRLYPAERP